MTIDIDAIRQREQAATDGPWWAWDRGVGYVIAIGTPNDLDEHDRPARELPEGMRTDIGRREDAEFIAHARQDIPALLDDRDENLAALRDVLAELKDRTAQVADLADKLHKANADNASHTKAGTAWANEVAAKDKVVEAAKAWVHADVADFGRTGAALIDAVADLPQKAEVA